MSLKKMESKGISPVIATVILIGIGVVLAGMIFLWANNLLINLGPLGLKCDKANFEAGVFCNGNTCIIEINNRGTELRGFVVKSKEESSIIVEETVTATVRITNSLRTGLGKIYEKDDILLIVPIIFEESDDGGSTYLCSDNAGVEIVVE